MNARTLQKYIRPKKAPKGANNQLHISSEGEGLTTGQPAGTRNRLQFRGFPAYSLRDNRLRDWVLEKIMNQAQQHESDFYSWTQEQAALLRKLPRESNLLDIDNIAEEIEDMGRAEINQITNLLVQTLTHVIKIAADPEAQPVAHWVSEADNFQSQAIVTYSPGLRQRLDLPKIWKLAKRGAGNALAEFAVAMPSLPDDCPMTLDQLLDQDFSPRVAAVLIANAFTSTQKPSL
jgi:hypothetical protein